MQLPYSLVRRGLLALMDEEDRPRGLFGFFGKDSNDEDTASDGGPPGAGSAVPLAPTDDSSEPTVDYVRRQLSLFGKQILTNPLGVRPPTRNPVTGEYIYLPYVNSVGERYSESLPPPPNGVTPPSPKSTGPVTTLSRPGFLFGPGAGAISWPPAEDAGTLVYSFPPGKMSREDCDEQEREELARCHSDYGKVYGYNTWPFHACKQRTQDRAILCRKGRTDGPPPWSARDMESSYIPKNHER